MSSLPRVVRSRIAEYAFPSYGVVRVVRRVIPFEAIINGLFKLDQNDKIMCYNGVDHWVSAPKAQGILGYDKKNPPQTQVTITNITIFTEP